MPETKDFTTRLPPHVYTELRVLLDGCSSQLRKKPTNSDMVGALVLRARQQRRGLLDDLSQYLDVKDTWEKDGTEILPGT